MEAYQYYCNPFKWYIQIVLNTIDSQGILDTNRNAVSRNAFLISVVFSEIRCHLCKSCCL